MGTQTFSLKNIGRDIFIPLIFSTIIQCGAAKLETGPKREVISIYNTNFTTPENRDPYFVEVYRCVALYTDEDQSNCGADNNNIVPDNWTKIEIVVPDLGNKTKFYKYVIYNHTSCICTNESKPTLRNISKHSVNKSYFESKRHNNPENLRNRCDFCKEPQPRYKEHPNFNEVYAKDRYLPYIQCLPGCYAATSNTTTLNTCTTKSTNRVVDITNETQCQTYRKTTGCKKCAITNNAQAAVQQQTSSISSKLVGQEPNYDLLLAIGSVKVVLVAVLLALVLFTILIVDFTLCRRKTGLLYTLSCCTKNNDMGNICEHYTQRNLNQITV